MAITKKKDLCVVVGKYTDKSGAEKNSYRTIGSLMESDKGDFILLDPFFNTAAVQREAGRDRIMVSMFDPKDSTQPEQSQHNKANANAYQAQKDNPQPMDDSIPF
jgi:hypothetical protein